LNRLTAAIMNCRDLESLILAERDGVLTTEQHAVAACPACRAMHARRAEASAFLKTDAANVPVPDVDGEWNRVRAQLHAEKTKPVKKRPLAPVIWFGAPLAAAAAFALAFFLSRPVPVPEEATDTIAYVDKESGWLVVWTAESGAKNG
jgi:hypothetical protein